MQLLQVLCKTFLGAPVTKGDKAETPVNTAQPGPGNQRGQAETPVNTAQTGPGLAPLLLGSTSAVTQPILNSS